MIWHWEQDGPKQWLRRGEPVSAYVARMGTGWEARIHTPFPRYEQLNLLRRTEDEVKGWVQRALSEISETGGPPYATLAEPRPEDPPRDHTQRDRVRAYVKERMESGAWDLTRADVRARDEVVHVRLEYVRGSMRFIIDAEMLELQLQAMADLMDYTLSRAYEKLQRKIRETP